MTSLVDLDLASSVPPFEQLRQQVAAQVADGSLAAGAKLPTVRQLAADLDLAPNTVARAYRELEGGGVIVTRGRRGTFVADAVLGTDAAEDARSAAASLASVGRRLGLSLPETTRLVEEAWAQRG